MSSPVNEGDDFYKAGKRVKGKDYYAINGVATPIINEDGQCYVNGERKNTRLNTGRGLND